MSSSTYAVDTGVDVESLLSTVGGVYATPRQVVKELVENATDAGSPIVWIVIERDSIRFIDMGHGMVPMMPPEDQRTVKQYKAGELHLEPGQDIRDLVSPLARKSLEWMVSLIGRSARIHEQGEHTKALLGIGAQSYRAIADKAVWYSVPNPELAAAYYAKLTSGQPPVYMLEPPTERMMRIDHVRENRIGPASRKLKDPDGKTIPHGTEVVITGLKEGALDTLRPTPLAEYLGAMYGGDIRAGRYKLIVVDLYSEEGRKVGGRKITVEPPPYKGVPLVQTDGHLKSGQHPFKVDIWYDSRATNLQLKLVWRGTARGNLTNLPELNIEPWNLGILSGEVEFPDVDMPGYRMSSDKTRPEQGPGLTQWLNSLRYVAEDVKREIAQIEEKKKDHARIQRARQVEQAVLMAMKEIPLFRELTLGIPAPKSKTRRKKPSKRFPPKEDLRSMVFVINEHRHPVAGVKLEVLRNGHPYKTYTTGLSGTADLGVLDKARYKVLLLDKRQHEPEFHGFEITVNQPKVRYYFSVTTGEPKKATNKIRGVQLFPKKLDDPGQLYSLERIGSGLLEINTGFAPYRAALDSGDVELQVLIETDALARGLTHHAFPNEPLEFINSNAALLFTTAYSNVRASFSKKRP